MNTWLNYFSKNEEKKEEIRKCETKKIELKNDYDKNVSELDKRISTLTKEIKNLNDEHQSLLTTIFEKNKKIKEQNIEKDNIIKKKNQEIECIKLQLEQHIQKLDQREIEYGKVQNDLLEIKNSRGKKICNSVMEEKSKLANLNDKLPSVLHIATKMEHFYSIVESFILDTDLEDCKEEKIADIIKKLFGSSYKTCSMIFNDEITRFYKSPTNNQEYDFRCLFYSSIGNFTTKACQTVFSLCFQHPDPNDSNYMKKAHDFIYSCCKFNFDIILSQPKVKYNDNTENGKEYSADEHESFGKVSTEFKMFVSSTIIPSIHKISDDVPITKSYVLLKSIIPHISPSNETKENLSVNDQPPVDNAQENNENSETTSPMECFHENIKHTCGKHEFSETGIEELV
ncbi:hypothetical protein ACTA71_007208 [Dictyostelium dimigraforme]